MKRPVLLAALFAIVLGDLLLLGGLNTRIESGRPSPQPSPSPKHPPAWNERVAPLITFVEQKRGLTFKQPVFVDFLTPEEYTKEVTGTELTNEDEEDIRQAEGLSRSLGLIKPETDLLKEAETLADEGTAAFYSSEDKRVRVRGTEMTPALRVTLVHELVHALQDQHYDLSRIDELKTSGEQLAFTGLVEGDAIRIENQYIESLPEAEAKSLEEAEGALGGEVSEVPPGLLALFSAGHAMGETFVEFLVALSSAGEVDKAFRNPPKTEEHLFDPFTYLSSETPRLVEEVKLAKGETSIDKGDFGALTWYVILALRIDPQVAISAADGWGGDSYAAVMRGKEACIRANFIGDTPADSDEMFLALDAWVKLMPGGASSVSRTGETINFSSCDPGKAELPAVRDDADVLLALPLGRVYLAIELIEAGATRTVARCASRRISEAFSLQELTTDKELSRSDEARITKLVQACA